MVVLERPSGAGISETSAAEVVEVCDEARVVAALHAGRRQLILVVLRERSVDSNVFKFNSPFQFWCFDKSFLLTITLSFLALIQDMP